MSQCHSDQNEECCTIADGPQMQQERRVGICDTERGGGKVVSSSCLALSVSQYLHN